MCDLIPSDHPKEIPSRRISSKFQTSSPKEIPNANSQIPKRRGLMPDQAGLRLHESQGWSLGIGAWSSTRGRRARWGRGPWPIDHGTSTLEPDSLELGTWNLELAAEDWPLTALVGPRRFPAPYVPLVAKNDIRTLGLFLPQKAQGIVRYRRVSVAPIGSAMISPEAAALFAFFAAKTRLGVGSSELFRLGV